MSEPFGGLFQNFGELLKLAQDKDFQKFLLNPKIRALMQDQKFQRAVKEKNFFKLTANQEFAELLKDPEVSSALEEVRKKFEKHA